MKLVIALTALLASTLATVLEDQALRLPSSNHHISVRWATGPFRSDREFEIVQQTIYAEARGEPLEGQKAVAWVIYNRSRKGGYFGSTMEEVCLKPYQFACWNSDIKPTWYPPKEIGAYNKIGGWLKSVFQGKDYSNGADHYNNPSKEGYPEWTKNCVVTVKIGQHVFYKER